MLARLPGTPACNEGGLIGTSAIPVWTAPGLVETRATPVTRCQICRRTVAYRPGKLSEVLTEHYRRAHPEALGLPVSQPWRSAPSPQRSADPV
jgi:hypothetical protein